MVGLHLPAGQHAWQRGVSIVIQLLPGGRVEAGRGDAELGQLGQAVVGNHGGIVNKYMVDALMAIFGAPLPLPDLGQDELLAVGASVLYYAAFDSGGNGVNNGNVDFGGKHLSQTDESA